TQSSLLLPSRGDMQFYNDWARQILHGQFSQSLAFYGLPGYAYLLAGFYKIFGENPFLPGLLQAALDAGTAVLIFRICVAILTRLRSASNTKARIVAALAAVGWVYFVPAQAYTVVLMPTAWFVFVFWFVVWRLVRTQVGLSLGEC